MTNDFYNWLAKNGLTELFTTRARDSLYVNTAKGFFVVRKDGEFGVSTYYLGDIMGVRVTDDEHTLVEWDRFASWKVHPRSERYSCSGIKMTLYLNNGTSIALWLFNSRIEGKKIPRTSNEHVDMCNYACNLAQSLVSCCSG